MYVETVTKAAKNKQQKMKAAASARRPTAPATASGAQIDLTAFGGLEALRDLEGASESELDDAAIALATEVGLAAKSMQAAQESSA